MLPMLTTSRVSGSFLEVAWKNGIAIVDRNLPSGLLRSTISLPLLARTAETSVMNCAAGEASSGFEARSNAYLKLDAVTGVPSLNRNPLRMKNV